MFEKLARWKTRLAGAGILAAVVAGAPAYATSLAAVPATARLQALHPAMRQALSYGDNGHWVMTLQADLTLLGFNAGPVDGVFGPKTENGVKAFQLAHELPATGRTDPSTWQDILSGFGLTPPATAPAAVSSTSKTIDGRPVIAEYHVLATAYGPSLQDNYPYGPTNYFGQPLQPGTIAVDPSLIPLKSTVYVTGYHDSYLPSPGFVGRALDTGGAIQGRRIDIYMNEGPSVISRFGIQPVTVYVLGQ